MVSRTSKHASELASRSCTSYSLASSKYLETRLALATTKAVNQLISLSRETIGNRGAHFSSLIVLGNNICLSFCPTDLPFFVAVIVHISNDENSLGAISLLPTPKLKRRPVVSILA